MPILIRFRPNRWRFFLKPLLLLFFLLSCWFTVTLHSGIVTAQDLKPEIRGVWFTTNDTEILHDQPKLEAAINELARLNFNTLYPVVWNSGYVKYPSAFAQQAGIQSFMPKGNQGQDPLADMVEKAHRRGLMVMPWFEFGFMTSLGSELAEKYPKWLTRRRDGEQVWNGVAGEVLLLNPFHPEVQQFITNLLLELVTQYNVDGIQFDDHMSLPNEFGYDPYTAALYKKATKKDPPANPSDPTWVKWRADQLTNFMGELRDALKSRRPDLYFSVSPNPYDVAYKAHLQDWLTWVRTGIVDELIVQVYRSDLQTFVDQISRSEIAETQATIPTGIGILSGLRNKPVPMQQVWQQVLAARDRGLGFSFFFYESLWDVAPEPPEERKARFQSLFYYPARRPTNTLSAPSS